MHVIILLKKVHIRPVLRRANTGLSQPLLNDWDSTAPKTRANLSSLKLGLDPKNNRHIQ